MRRYSCISPGSVIIFNPNHFDANPYFNQIIGIYLASDEDKFIGSDALYGTVLDFDNPSNWMLMSDFVNYYWGLSTTIANFERSSIKEIKDLFDKVDFVNKIIKYAETIRANSIIEEDKDTVCNKCIAAAANIISGYPADSILEYTLHPKSLPKNTELYTSIAFDIAIISDLEPLLIDREK